MFTLARVIETKASAKGIFWILGCITKCQRLETRVYNRGIRSKAGQVELKRLDSTGPEFTGCPALGSGPQKASLGLRNQFFRCKDFGTVQKGPVLGTSRRVYAHWNSVLVTWKFIKGIEC